MNNSITDYENLSRLIQTSIGKTQADLVLSNATVLNVFTKQFEIADIAICRGVIVGVGKQGSWQAERTVDYTGKYIVPGFIDSHVHIESSMLLPQEFASSVIEFGTTTVIADCHEIANVLGSDGVLFMIGQSKNAPVSIKYMIPSCVPATEFEHTGGAITAADVDKLLERPEVLGLGEMMNYPGLFNCDKEVLLKLKAASSCNLKKDGDNSDNIDGHCPKVTGRDLQAYCVSGIKTDHESSSFEEADEKLRAGLYIALRYGSCAKDLLKIVPGIVKSGIRTERFLFCTDDKDIGDIIKEGHISANIRESIRLGIKPEDAYCISSFNAANCYGLSRIGAVAAGYFADLVVLDNLEAVEISAVYKNGNLIESKELQHTNSLSSNVSDDKIIDKAIHSVKLQQISAEMFKFGWENNASGVSSTSNTKKTSELTEYAIKLIPHLLVTEKIVLDCADASEKLKEGKLCRLSVFERYKNTGNHSLCLLDGYGLVRGAIASSIGHDSHNVICAGASPADMKLAVERIAKIQGGICIALNNEIIAELLLPIAGLMSDKTADYVIKQSEELRKKTLLLGIPASMEPFVSLSFLALPVIPSLRLTDSGLFDVDNWKFLKHS